MAAMIDAACSGSRIRLQPALCLAIFGTGQPMLTSTMLAPICSTTRAASAILAGSPPKIWIDTGRSSSVYSAYSSVRSMPRTSPSLLTISDTTSPHPPWRFTRRRNAVSVMPAMGETTNGDSSSIDPIFKTLGPQDSRTTGFSTVSRRRRRLQPTRPGRSNPPTAPAVRGRLCVPNGRSRL